MKMQGTIWKATKAGRPQVGSLWVFRIFRSAFLLEEKPAVKVLSKKTREGQRLKCGRQI